jgi:succinate-semialdehyde dehydrogenase/glutarate-semialdehyde dehydrogenase
VIGPTATTYNPLISSPKVRKISLTGSTSIGRQMIRDAAATMKRVSMELGGNAPLVVFPDADLDKTLDLAVPTKFANAGQVCVTPDRFFIHNSIYDAFVEGFVRRTKALRLGHGLADGTDMGPLINDKRRRAIETVIEDAENRGGIIQTGGVRPADRNSGFFFEPTVITGLPDDALAIAEENFGPVAAITRFENADDVYARANSGSFGLSAYVFTRDPARIREAIERIETGMIGINSFALAAAEAPFGGIHDSGMGREGGSEGISDYLDVKLAQVTI